ncbi:MAG TPA: lasso peptide biosynthesis B2 protein [Pyrinomonadaceae bacterium]|nr:lasso peptide biosynthesis B2 protein [Pyrinomonadaceae bacterium]
MAIGAKHSIQQAWQLALLTSGFIYHRPGSAFLLIRMAGWVGLVTVLSRLLTLPRVAQVMRLGRRGVTSRNKGDNIAARDDLAGLLDMLLRTKFLCFTPTCWKRALVLQRYLALSSIESEVVFGVRKEKDNRLIGHAWLEANGQPLLESDPPDYVKTFTFPFSVQQFR